MQATILLLSRLVLFVSLFTGFLRGAPLWEQAINGAKSSQGMVAARVRTEIQVYDGAEAFLGSMESLDTVSSWEKTPLVWSNVSKRTVGKPGFTMELNLRIEEDPSNVLDGYAGWTHRGTDTVDGVAVEKWEGKRAGADDNWVLAYLEPEGGQPRRVEMQLPIRSSFGTRLVKITIGYGAGPDGMWLPQSATIDQAGRFVMWRRHLVVKKTYEGWVRRPTP